MAVVNTLSTLVTNADATPRVMNDVRVDGAKTRTILATVEIAAADEDLSVYRLCRLKSHWIVKSIRKFNDTITGGTDFNVGLLDTAENGGAAVDDNVYGDAVSLATADLVGTEIAFEARGIELIGQKVFEDAGLTTDPGKEYDLAFSAVTVGTASGTLSVAVEILEGS